jgi:hypothetical protein
MYPFQYKLKAIKRLSKSDGGKSIAYPLAIIGDTHKDQCGLIVIEIIGITYP